MHIVFLTGEFPDPKFPHGGIGTYVKIISSWLSSYNHSVSVVGINYINKYQDVVVDNVRVIRLKRFKLKGVSWLLHSLSLNKKLNELHKQSPIDIIEGSESSFAFIKKIFSVKYLIRLHGGHHFFAEAEKRKINRWKAFQEHLSFRKADKIIGVSQFVINHSSNFINFNSKKSGVIFNPADLSRFYKSDISKSIRGRIFFAGTICEKKGIRQLVLALPHIKKKIPDAHLVIAGRDWFFPKSGKSYTEYLKQFIDPVVSDSVFFLGSVPNSEIPALIEQAEVCCYPSHMEAMPLAWIEVMAMGKPFVGSKLGPGPEIITSNFNGLLCDPLNPIDIADKVIYMLLNKSEALKMGENARTFALENFSLDVIGPKNLQLYNSLL